MLTKTKMKFSHMKPGATEFKGEGLRDFFLYRDLGVADATAGKVLAQLVRANAAPAKGTGWHYHGADFHIVYMLKGWARFMYGETENPRRGRRAAEHCHDVSQGYCRDGPQSTRAMTFSPRPQLAQS